jgi:hypothetical protein
MVRTNFHNFLLKALNRMPEKLEIPIQNVKSVVRQLVEQLWPHEVDVFDMGFGQLAHWPHHWEHIEPAEWKVGDLLVESMDTGYAFPGTIPAETPPWFHFGLVIQAVAEYFRRLGKVPEKDEIEQQYKNFASLCELPQEVFDVGKPVAITFIQSYFRGGVSPFPVSGGYVVYEGLKKHTFYEKSNLEKFRVKKKTYDIYVDDLISEILVKGKKPNLLAGETNSFLLLKCLLQRVGNHWTHEDLFKKLKLIYGEQDRVNVVTNARPLLHRNLELIRESFRCLAGKTKTDRWFDSSKPRRIAVWNGLNSCLIESLS